MNMRTYHNIHLDTILSYDHGAIRRDIISLMDIVAPLPHEKVSPAAKDLIRMIDPDKAYVKDDTLTRLYHYLSCDPIYLLIPFVRDVLIADLSRNMTENDRLYVLMCQILTRFLPQTL